MELSVDQKIKAAIEPLLERITALEADNMHFKQEITALQAHTQPKTNHKQVPKPVLDHGQRPQTAKPIRKQPQHHEVKPEVKPIHRVGQKKEQTKLQNEEGKIQGNKVAPKTTNASNKALPTPPTHKDSNDPKPVKPKPISTTSIKHNVGLNVNKGGATDKKSASKNHQVQVQKKQQGQQEKKHTSQQKQHKTNSTHGVKSPITNKPKHGQKQPDKKPIVSPSPAPGNKKQPPITQKPEPKPSKGGKSKIEPEAEIKEQKKKEETEAQLPVSEQTKQQIETLPKEVQQPNLGNQEKITKVEQVKEEAVQQVAEQNSTLQKQQEKVETAQGGKVEVKVQNVQTVEQHKEPEVVHEQAF